MVAESPPRSRKQTLSGESGSPLTSTRPFHMALSMRCSTRCRSLSVLASQESR